MKGELGFACLGITNIKPLKSGNGSGIWEKSRLGVDGIWAKFGLGNGICNPSPPPPVHDPHNTTRLAPPDTSQEADWANLMTHNFAVFFFFNFFDR